jgi:tryptophanyl-tRNA synthetase
MAADILLYDAKYVPLGEDQFQHLELARNIGIRMNNKFNEELFTIPAPEKEQIKFMHLEKGLRIRSLVDPTKKMSKSSDNAKSKISLNDNPSEAAKKITSATTDNEGIIRVDMVNQPGISNLRRIEALLNDRDIQDVISDWAGQTSYGDLKKKVAQTVESFITEFQEKVAAVTDEQVEAVLQKGEEYANRVANAKLAQIQRAVGVRK